MSNETNTFFAPHLAIRILQPAIEFYQKAFDAKILRAWHNDDGSVHVAELEIDGAMFHIHEENQRQSQLSPESVKATTSLIGLFTSDPDRLIKQAADLGGEISSPIQDYDYGYRQGVIRDPFGHQWLIQKRI